MARSGDCDEPGPSTGRTTRCLSPLVGPHEAASARYLSSRMSYKATTQAERIAELRAGLDGRIAREFGDELESAPSLSDVMSEREMPLTWFVDQIVFDECDQHGVAVGVIISDADASTLDGVATIIRLDDWRYAQTRPVPARVIWVDWGDFDGAEGARQLAEEFYAAFKQFVGAESEEGRRCS